MSAPGRPPYQIVGAASLIFAVAAGLLCALLWVALRLPGFGSAGPGWQTLAMAHAPILLVFSAIQAMIGGFGVLFVPPRIGAKNTSFPRLALASLLLVATGFCLTLAGLLTPGPALLLAAVNLTALGLALCAADLVTTILNRRAPLVGYATLSVFVWSQLIACCLLLCVAPVLAAALSMALLHHLPLVASLRPLLPPLLCVALLPALGLCLEIVATATGRPVAGRRILVAVLALVACIVFMIGAKTVFDRLALPAIAASAMISLTVLATVVCCLATLGSAGALRRCGTPAALFALGFLALSLVSVVAPAIGAGLTHDGPSLALSFALFAGFYHWAARPIANRLGRAQMCLLSAGVAIMLLPWPAAQALGSACITLSVVLFAAVLLTMVLDHHRMPVATPALPNR